MAKHRKHSLWPLLLGMGIYALVILTAAFFGLRYLWNYLKAYEDTRPEHTLNAYMEALSPEYILRAGGGFAAEIDPNLQPQEVCRAYLTDFLKGTITSAKDLSQCTDTKLVYTLRCGSRVIGSMTMVPQGEPRYGFRAWAVESNTFDLSFLLGKPQELLLPAECTVTVGGAPLGEAYITQRDIPYPALEGYYDKYDLPSMVRYQIPALLGEPKVSITDPDGTEVLPEEDFSGRYSDYYLDPDGKVQEAVRTFLKAYIGYISCAGNNTPGNLSTVRKYIVSGSDLEQRVIRAQDGLQWVSDRHAVLTELVIHSIRTQEDGSYLCSLRYTVESTPYGKKDVAVSDLEILMVPKGETLLAASMTTK